MFEQIPTSRPDTPLLDSIASPADLKALNQQTLAQLAYELRNYLLYSVGQSGGHFGAGLGVVELTIALHYLLETPQDQIIWDVGHQCYPHKILTGRREQLPSIRHSEGLAPFPDRQESAYDAFGTGHSSTSISAALGMALANRLKGDHRKSVAVIGDGALTAGMAFEALNHAAHTAANLLVILNDNAMSISPNQGGLASYLASNLRVQVPTHPVMPLFEALNFNYAGPVDGHDLSALVTAISDCLQKSGPQFLHIRTLKGKGYGPAERDPVGFHALAKIEEVQQTAKAKPKTYSNSFGDWLVEAAHKDSRVVAITPAMREGSDLIKFSEQYPERYFDVAIAEQHAATLAAGLAVNGMKPVLAIYSTFLQRAVDQLVHDIALQKLDILIAIDRAGLVGEDGATHVGAFDLSYLTPLPGIILMTPSNYEDQKAMLQLGLSHSGPAVVRYPRGTGPTNAFTTQQVKLGESAAIRKGKRAAILNFGPLLETGLKVAKELDLTLIDMRFVTPLDESALRLACTEHPIIITLEDHAVQGGAGGAVLSWIARQNLSNAVLTLGIENVWTPHASREEQLSAVGLDSETIKKRVQERLNSL